MNHATENRGVPGSTPGPATFYFLSISRKIAYWPSLARPSVSFSSPPRGVAAPITFPCLARQLFKLYLLRQSYTRPLPSLMVVVVEPNLLPEVHDLVLYALVQRMYKSISIRAGGPAFHV
jgi:hypothetical protein